jgi:hypothetical protein
LREKKARKAAKARSFRLLSALKREFPPIWRFISALILLYGQQILSSANHIHDWIVRKTYRTIQFIKTILLSTLFLLALFVLMQSCQKELVHREFIKELTIDTTITAGTHYYLDLTPYGDEGDMAMVTEPGNYFSVSRLEDVTDMFTYIYHYSPGNNSSDTKDRVTISIKRYSPEEDSTVIHINFAIK